MARSPSNPNTRYEAVTRPHESAVYPQRIKMWEAVQRLGSANRSELLKELRRTDYAHPNGGPLDEVYCRVELTKAISDGLATKWLLRQQVAGLSLR